MVSTQRTLSSFARNAQNGADAGLQLTEEAVDRVKDSLQEVKATLDGKATEWRDEAAPVVNRLTERATDMARTGAQWVRDGSGRVRNEVARASDRAVGYAREEPVKSALMAAAAGAVLFALVRMLGSRSQR